MKKIAQLIMITLITLFFNIPLISAAENDIEIKSVELVEKSTNTIELENAKFEDLNVWFKLKFFELNDNAKYKIVISNSSTEDYLVNNNSDELKQVLTLVINNSINLESQYNGAIEYSKQKFIWEKLCKNKEFDQLFK